MASCHTPNSNVTLCTSIVFWILPYVLNGQGVKRRRRRCVYAQVQSILQSTGFVIYNTKLHSTHFVHHTHTRCHPVKCTAITGIGKDAQLLLSISHVTVSQSDPVRNTYNYAIHCTQTCIKCHYVPAHLYHKLIVMEGLIIY